MLVRFLQLYMRCIVYWKIDSITFYYFNFFGDQFLLRIFIISPKNLNMGLWMVSLIFFNIMEETMNISCFNCLLWRRGNSSETVFITVFIIFIKFWQIIIFQKNVPTFFPAVCWFPVLVRRNFSLFEKRSWHEVIRLD